MGVNTNHYGDYRTIAKRIRDELGFFSDSTCQERHRDEWPCLWAAIDELKALVDRDDPPHEPSPRLFDPSGQRVGGVALDAVTEEGPCTGPLDHGRRQETPR